MFSVQTGFFTWPGWWLPFPAGFGTVNYNRNRNRDRRFFIPTQRYCAQFLTHAKEVFIIVVCRVRLCETFQSIFFQSLRKNVELLELVGRLCDYYEEARQYDTNKNIWRRFFSLVDQSSMLLLIVFNTVLTVFIFRSVIFWGLCSPISRIWGLFFSCSLWQHTKVQ